jgi:hypothetical protein
MIIDTIEKFVEAVPTASGTEFQAIKPFVYEADADVIASLIGVDLYNHIEAKSNDDRMNVILRNLIASDAYAKSIPFVDLIQTSNGFAVVNNSNVAPASKERVERLIAQCVRTVDTCTDLLINQVLLDTNARTEWAKFDGFKELTSCFFLTGKDWSTFSGQSNTGRVDFIKVKPSLLAFQKAVLEPAISKVYVDELIGKIRSGTLTTAGDREVVSVCKFLLSTLVNKRIDEARINLDKLVHTIESDIDSFTTYKDSAEYALKNTANYQNKMDDSTFFFGV